MAKSDKIMYRLKPYLVYNSKIQPATSQSLIAIRKKAVDILLKERTKSGDFCTIYNGKQIVGMVMVSYVSKHKTILWDDGNFENYWLCNKDGTLGKKVWFVEERV